MPVYTVRYYAGTYSGKRTVSAEDEQEAIEKVRSEVRRQMTLSMYSDGYKIVSGDDEQDGSDEE